MDPNVEEDNGRRCGCCCCLKYCIFYILTILIWIGGIVLLAIGIYYFVGLKHLEDLTGYNLGEVGGYFMWPAIYFIVVGSLRFIACFIGCCGSIKGSTCLLKAFLIVLTVVFIIELVIEISMAVLAFTAQDYISNTLKNFWQSSLEGYQPQNNQVQIVDHIQIGLSCCGLDNYNDYESNNLYRCSSTNPTTRCSVPYSCCKDTSNRQCGAQARDQGMMGVNSVIYTDGCVQTLMDKLRAQTNILIIGLTLLGIMLVMLFTIIFGFCILRHANNREGGEGTDVRMDLLKSEREYDA